MVNLPAPFTSFVPTTARLARNLLAAAGFCSVAAARAAAIPVFDMAAPFMAAPFMAAAFIARGAMDFECFGTNAS